MTKNHLDAYEAVLHEAALVDAESRRSTPAEKGIAAGVKARVHDDLAKMRRDLLPEADPPMCARPIPRSLLAMARDALLATLDTILERLGGTVQYAHRDRTGLTDDDLRQLIHLLDPSITE
jgi:hypothetical protein